MVKEDMYVRRRKVILICMITTIVTFWLNAFFLPSIYQPRPTAYAENGDKTPLTTNSTVTTSVTTTTSASTTTTTSTSTTTTTSTSTTTSTTTTLSSSTTTTTTFTTTVVEETSSEEINIEESNDDTCTAVEDEASAECVESAFNVESEYEPGEYPDEYVFSSGYVKGSADYILLCNCLGLEYGSDTVDIYEKAKVIEVILNRVSSSLYPDTVYGVISAPYQFSGCSEYLYLNIYSKRVTYSVMAAVDWYLEEGWQTSNHGYVGFSGDGTWNYFH